MKNYYLYGLTYCLFSLLYACGGDNGGGGGGGTGGGGTGTTKTGAEYYVEHNCQLCHGNNGEGAGPYAVPISGPNQACVFTDCSDKAQLDTYLIAEMPDGNPTACVGECATKIADYMLTLSGVAAGAGGGADGGAGNGDGGAGDGGAVVDPNSVAYKNSCAVCHGDKGEGVAGIYDLPIGPNVCQIVNCADREVLTDYVEVAMPPGNVAACAGDCAVNTTLYILSNFGENPAAQSLKVEDDGVVVATSEDEESENDNNDSVEEVEEAVVEEEDDDDKDEEEDKDDENNEEELDDDKDEEEVDDDKDEEEVDDDKDEEADDTKESAVAQSKLGNAAIRRDMVQLVADYNKFCSDCVLVCDKVDCTDMASIRNYINLYLPDSDPQACAGDCAYRMSVYIYYNLNPLAASLHINMLEVAEEVDMQVTDQDSGKVILDTN